MQDAWEAIKRYVAGNAQNLRKGYRLGDLSDAEQLQHAAEEMQELLAEPNSLEELADTVACLFHYAQRKGWSMKQIEQSICKKLATRFSPPTESPVHLSVEVAKLQRRCRICRQGVNIRGIPSDQEDQFYQVSGRVSRGERSGPIVLNYGQEFAHRTCLEQAGIPIPSILEYHAKRQQAVSTDDSEPHEPDPDQQC